VPSHAAPFPGEVGLNLRNRRLFVTTNTLDTAIAAPASIGLGRPAAARGMAARLSATP
jgi:hypothetical protein